MLGGFSQGTVPPAFFGQRRNSTQQPEKLLLESVCFIPHRFFGQDHTL